MHLDSVTSPPFFSYTCVAWVGQTRLHTPHLVHFCSSLCRRVRAICLNGVNVLNRAVSPPRGQILHQKRLYARDTAVIAIRMARFIEVKYEPVIQNGPYVI